jgi:MraZ protein
VKIVEIDALGRLLVPKISFLLQKYLKKLFSSAVNIIEIWDKDLYEKSINGRCCRFAEK